MRPYTLLALLTICMITTVYSCKKSNNGNGPDPGPVSYNARTMDYEHAHIHYTYRIAYNSKNDVDSIISTGVPNPSDYYDKQIFTYYGDSACHITKWANGGISQPDVYLSYNADGMVTRSLTLNDSEYNTYSGKELNRVTTQAQYLKYDRLYTWSDGDLVKSLNVDSSLRYTVVYDMSKQVNRDFYPLPDTYLKTGKPDNSSKHLPTRRNSLSDYSISYDYTFDTKGRLTKMTKVYLDVMDTMIYTYGY